MKTPVIKLRNKFILYVIMMHLILLGLSFQLLSYNPLYFIFAEILIILSILYTVHLYGSLIKPINLISSGIDMLKEKDFNTRLAKTGQSEIDSIVDVYNKLSAELREERIKQIEQNYFLDKLIQASPSGIIVLDLDGKIASVNPSILKMLETGDNILTGKKLGGIDGFLAHEISLLEEGKSKVVNLSGSKFYRCYKSYFLDQGFQRYFYIVEEMTQEMLKTERKAYEKVIRMMAHEINNSIGAVNSFLQSFLNYKEQLKNEDKEDFENSLNIAIERNSRLNQFMSNFSDIIKLPEPKRELADLNQLLLTAEKMFRCECENRNIMWEWHLSDKPLNVEFDTIQMEQVIYNIIKNSIESIDKNGKIFILTEDGSQKKLIIRDTGKGISKEIKNQLFTPFFSTKKNGQGIGLTLVKDVLLNHNFKYSLESKSKGYTEFEIVF